MKLCTSCLIAKPPDQFFVRKASKDGLSYVCKLCDTIRRRARREANPDYERAYQAKYRQKNLERRRAKDLAYYARNRTEMMAGFRRRYWSKRDEAREKFRAWCAENPERVLAWNRQKRAKHGDLIRARRRADYAKNKARYKANVRRRDADKLRATPAWANHEKIIALYAEAARLTIETGIEHHVDHIVPLRHKLVCGLHVEANLQIITAEENLAKGNRFGDAELGLVSIAA